MDDGGDGCVWSVLWNLKRNDGFVMNVARRAKRYGLCRETDRCRHRNNYL